jgi:hypothetical protein
MFASALGGSWPDFLEGHCGQARNGAGTRRALLSATMQSQSGKSEVMLVAIEYGGRWQANLAPRPTVDLIMVVQLPGEDPLAFARRFLAKVLTVITRGSEVVSAVLAVAPSFDSRDLAARCAIVRVLLRTFRRGSRCQLHLVEPNEAAPECRAHLLAIAEGLTENALTDCDIRVGNEIFTGADAAVARMGGQS